jgi:hypothetical protein
MSQYAKELAQRIARNEPVHITRDWYLKCLCTDRNGVDWDDLTPQETEFMRRTVESFAAWMIQKRQH